MIWKALSDPTRRSILNLLRSAPRTTGEISDQFDLSRFAIMKHLGVLEKADLITIKREGKFRYNYLNPKPIQNTYEEWVSNLTQLSFYTEPTTRKMGKNKKSIHSSKVDLVFTYKATKKVVWQNLTQKTSSWWMKDCFTHPKTKKVILELKPGGLLYEDISSKEGFVWATVTGIHHENTLLLKGQVPMDFGGPALSFLNISLESKGRQTTLRVTDVILGEVSDNLLNSLTKHWTKLFDVGLRALIEK
ncbi:MAG: metalloregulator ArsR/SmtB family transcription factor [Saprospiraceae bacterium]